ncbi:cobalamin biosynthesis protein, partial [Burkholderia multivorans]|nr:cobalamin biosynthesis protein [Burkholderia multivorans]
ITTIAGEPMPAAPVRSTIWSSVASTCRCVSLVAFEPAQLAACAQRAASAPSAAALARFGVAGVAEPCAQLAAPHGRLLAPKTIRDGVTVALAGPL